LCTHLSSSQHVPLMKMKWTLSYHLIYVSSHGLSGYMSEFYWPTSPKLRRYIFTSNLHSSPWEQGYQARTKSRMLNVNFISNRALVVSHPSFLSTRRVLSFAPSLQVCTASAKGHCRVRRPCVHGRSAIIIARAWKWLSRWKNREIVVSLWLFLVEQPIYIFYLVKANDRN
jgi:hypothetical protein